MTEQNLPGVSSSDEVVVNTDADVVVHAEGDVVESSDHTGVTENDPSGVDPLPTGDFAPASDENVDLHLEPGGEGQVQVQPGPGQHLSRGGQMVDDEPEEPTSEGMVAALNEIEAEEINPEPPDLESPSARHVKELRKREIKRHKAAAPVAEQIRIQLAEAGLA